MRRIMARCVGKDKHNAELTSFHEYILGFTDERSEERVVKILFDIINGNNTKHLFPAQSGNPEVQKKKISSIAAALASTKYCLRIFTGYNGSYNKDDDITIVVHSLRHQASNYDHKYGVGLGRFTE